MNGRFEWGKLSAIVGAPGSGKSSLLHALGAQYVGSGADIGGSICYDDKPLDETLLPWQQCGFVEAIDEHFRDLSVKDVLTYAMQLRCIDTSRLVHVCVLRFWANCIGVFSVEDIKTKDLTSGQLRRLSIGEEIVHGPNLICLDEPITDLDERETSTIMT
ncbi:ABCG27, partial [Symbiodinium microadriaticum]